MSRIRLDRHPSKRRNYDYYVLFFPVISRPTTGVIATLGPDALPRTSSLEKEVVQLDRNHCRNWMRRIEHAFLSASILMLKARVDTELDKVSSALGKWRVSATTITISTEPFLALKFFLYTRKIVPSDEQSWHVTVHCQDRQIVSPVGSWIGERAS